MVLCPAEQAPSVLSNAAPLGQEETHLTSHVLVSFTFCISCSLELEFSISLSLGLHCFYTQAHTHT